MGSKPIKPTKGNHHDTTTGNVVTSDESSFQGTSNLSPGVYAGIAIEVFVFMMLIGILGYYYMKKSQINKTNRIELNGGVA